MTIIMIHLSLLGMTSSRLASVSSVAPRDGREEMHCACQTAPHDRARRASAMAHERCAGAQKFGGAQREKFRLTRVVGTDP